MSNFQIHELTEKAINRNSKIIHDTLSGGSYETGNNLAGAIADLASANVAGAYNSATTYAIGQYCLYEGDIYRCIAITTGTFDATKWTQIVVTSEFRRVVELTSAQYSALSSAEKNNGTLYILTDEETTAADIPYSAGVSVADKLDSLTIYSSTETVIGKWIDNKPIYRKILTGTISSNALVVGIGCDVDNVINLRCYLKKTNNLIFSIPYRNEVSANEYYQAYVFVNDTVNNNEVAVLCSSSNADYFNGSSIIAIVEYTKA